LGVAYLLIKIGKIARAEFQSLAKIVTVMQETALGAKVVKTFALEPLMRSEMNDAVEGVRGRANKIAQISAATTPLMDTLGGIAIGLTVFYAGWRVIDGGADPGSFFSFLTALLMAYDPARRIARMNVQLRARLTAVGIMYDLLDQEPKLIEKEQTVSIPDLDGGYTIDLDGVSFAYDEAPALHDVSLRAAAGETTALVGPSGGGKSTIFAMVQRFYDPQEGAVRINGVDLRDLSFVEARSLVSSVTQDPFLFGGTVRRNIELGRLGGQRQRIAIARAILRNAPILLLDEATAALDAESEARVSEALDRLTAGTTLVIAHRLSTIRHADKIVVIDKGEVVQSGTHDELNASSGLYQRLHTLQFPAAAE